ncbi:hypothetical protein SAMN05421806_116143 [Streptomyces indicus]|uniref:Uncharacterized protein n=1 Tax=Streptomyces indicus TaxID=417292 RepID=A0A1G9GRC6_9ACTN|nr:hypothetical protein SAMN05421806_116143 [Streptomyces indicus]
MPDAESGYEGSITCSHDAGAPLLPQLLLHARKQHTLG